MKVASPYEDDDDDEAVTVLNDDEEEEDDDDDDSGYYIDQKTRLSHLLSDKKSYRFTLIRHGESFYNRDGDDRPDPGLTPLGIEQAQQLEGNYAYALVSCLKRARETFANSALQCQVVEISSLCREKATMVPNCMMGEVGFYENDEAFALRMRLLKLFLAEKSMIYDTIVVITHYGVIQALTWELLGNGKTTQTNRLNK